MFTVQANLAAAADPNAGDIGESITFSDSHDPARKRDRSINELNYEDERLWPKRPSAHASSEAWDPSPPGNGS